jgi:hypothetical protein
MNPMKRVGLVAMLVVLAGFCAASPVLAGQPALGFSLDPPPGSPEPDASGACMFKIKGSDPIEIVYNASLTCGNLTPRQEYVVYVYVVCYTDGDPGVYAFPVSADRNGKLTSTFRVPPIHSIDVTNAEGVVVLMGTNWWY